jgi:hypothetical protein
MKQSIYATCSESAANVQLIKSVFTEAQYEYVFENRESSLTYDVFLQAASLFPMFCGEFVTGTPNLETAEEACMRELSTLFAHIAYESGTRILSQAGDEEWRQGLKYLEDVNCVLESSSNSECARNTENTNFYAPSSGQMYFGRGPIGLRDNDMYGMFSRAYNQDVFSGETVLLEDPSSLTSDPLEMFTSAFWRYMTPFRPAPSLHAIVVGNYVPNADDAAFLIDSNFASTILAIAGRDECCQAGTAETTGSATRASNYLSFLTYFGLESESGLECRAMYDAFSWQGTAGSINTFWA